MEIISSMSSKTTIPNQFYQWIVSYIDSKRKYLGILGCYHTFGEAYDDMVGFFDMDNAGYKLLISENTKSQNDDIYYDISVFSINNYVLLKSYEVEIKRVLTTFDSNTPLIIPITKE